MRVFIPAHRFREGAVALVLLINVLRRRLEGAAPDLVLLLVALLAAALVVAALRGRLRLGVALLKYASSSSSSSGLLVSASSSLESHSAYFPRCCPLPLCVSE